MPRQRMQPGEHGRVTQWSSQGRYFASTYVRDADGKRRRVDRSSDKSAEDARRLLQRHLQQRRAQLDGGQIVTTRTTLAELFDLWIVAKAAEDGISNQSIVQYRQVWRTHGAEQIGELRVTEFHTSQASKHLLAMGAVTQAKRLRMILLGMYGLAVRCDVLAVNPIRETHTARTTRKPARAATPAEFTRIRAAVNAYVCRTRPSPRDGASRLLPAFIECLAATGVRPNEVLAIEWPEVDLLADPPTVTVIDTLIDHGRIPGKPVHRQGKRTHGAPPHTVILPRFGVEALTALIADTGGLEGLVFANRDGGLMSLANMRRRCAPRYPRICPG